MTVDGIIVQKCIKADNLQIIEKYVWKQILYFKKERTYTFKLLCWLH